MSVCACFFNSFFEENKEDDIMHSFTGIDHTELHTFFNVTQKKAYKFAGLKFDANDSFHVYIYVYYVNPLH